MKYITSNSINERMIKKAFEKAELSKRKTQYIVQFIKTSHEQLRIKSNLIKYGVPEKNIIATKKQNMRKAVSPKNLIRQATGQKLDLTEYYLSFIIS
jgi:hypothetical protein